MTFKLSERDFAYYDTDLHDWNVRPGIFDVLVGGSSRNLPLKETVEVQTTKMGYPALTKSSMLKDFRNHPRGKEFYPELVDASGVDVPPEVEGLSPEEAAEKRKARMAVMAFLDEMVVNKLPAFSQGRFTDGRLQQILQEVS